MDRRLWKCLGMLAFGLANAFRVDAAEPNAPVDEILRNWESTSADRGRDGLTIRTLQPFLGPLREASLARRFEWSLLNSNELQAVPADPAERQFLPAVRISINAEGQPLSVAVGQRSYAVRDLVRAEIVQVAAREAASVDSGIVRASFNPGGDKGTGATPADPRLKAVISRWVAASKSANAVRTRFERVDYDSATEVELHSSGVLVFCAPYYGLYHSKPTKMPAGESARIGLGDRSYVSLPGEETLLFWSGTELTQVDFPAKRYDVHERPATPREVLGAGSFDAVWQTLVSPQSALPMVVGLEEKELRTNYEWELVADDQSAIILKGTPVSGPDAMLYTSAQVVIDPVSFRTRATRMIDASGARETIHTFTDLVVSKEIAALGKWEPDLSGFVRNAAVPSVEPARFEEGDQPISPLSPAE